MGILNGPHFASFELFFCFSEKKNTWAGTICDKVCETVKLLVLTILYLVLEVRSCPALTF